MSHFGHLALAHGEELGNHADKIFRNVDDEQFDGLVQLAIDFARDHRGFRYHQLVAFAAHRLDNNRELKLAPAGDLERVGLLGVDDAQADVFLLLQEKALAQFA